MRRQVSTISLSLAFALGLGSPLLQAEVIQIPVGQQAEELKSIKRPTTGMTKARVKEEFGEPIKENPARGTPPISSWEYDNFIVYFEYDHVIHSVLKHRPYVD
jgi:hypothetical protein